MLTNMLIKTPAAIDTAMTKDSNEERDLRRQRTNAVRTAWVLAAIAAAIFAAFVLSGVMGQPAS